MPKLKKQPKNAYFFFMVDRKKELEREGYRFQGGMKDVASAVFNEWKSLSPDGKSFYENKAKEEKEKEKGNLHNKFTATGESYANVAERQAAQEEELKTMERVVDTLTTFAPDTEVDKRTFIIISTHHSCEVYTPHHQFWPLELAIGAFSLEAGLKSNYSTLINTEVLPSGYASDAKTAHEETGLPIPGSNCFLPKHKDYPKILNNIKNFVEHFIGDYPDKCVLFAMENDIKGADGCLQWLYDKVVDSLNEEEKEAMTTFINKLAFYKLPQLLLRFATMAKKRNPGYNHIMACYNGLEQCAVQVLNSGIYDYNQDIACSYHNLEEPSEKMHMCCRNMVLRRIYLLLREIVPNMNLEMKNTHRIEKFASNKVANRRVDIPTGQVRNPMDLPQPSHVYQAQLPLSGIPRAETNAREDQGSTFLNSAWGK